MADWFYSNDGTQHGPVSEMEIKSLIASGKIRPGSNVWREGMPQWLPLSAVPELNQSSPSLHPPLQQQGQTSNVSPYTTPQNAPNTPPYPGYLIPTDTLSVVSLVCGIISLLACYIWALFGIPAVICGHMSLKKIKHSQTPIQGRGMAIAGLVCGYIGIAIQIFVIGIFVVAFSSASSIRSNISPPSPVNIQEEKDDSGNAFPILEAPKEAGKLPQGVTPSSGNF